MAGARPWPGTGTSNGFDPSRGAVVQREPPPPRPGRARSDEVGAAQERTQLVGQPVTRGALHRRNDRDRGHGADQHRGAGDVGADRADSVPSCMSQTEAT